MTKPALFLVLLINAVRVAPTPESKVIVSQVRSPNPPINTQHHFP
ncbi:MAG: hypothetical protein RIE73_14610 [Coleofasciculus sp. C1-SOL-03]